MLGRTVITVACLAALAAAVGLPFGLHVIGGLAWSRLSDIGQAYGILAALLAAPSLGLVCFSVFMQARHARAAQEHNARLLHLELVRLMIGDRRLQMWRLRSWQENRRQQHADLWNMLWRTLYRVGSMNEEDLRLTVRRELFGQHTDKAFGGRFWERSREAYLASANSRKERKFHDIVDDEYRKAISVPGRARKSWLRRSIGMSALGGTVGICATQVTFPNPGPKKWTIQSARLTSYNTGPHPPRRTRGKWT